MKMPPRNRRTKGAGTALTRHQPHVRAASAPGKPPPDPGSSSPQELKQAALEIGQMLEKLGITPTTIAEGQDGQGLYDPLQAALSAALLDALGDPLAVQVVQALGLDPAALADHLARYEGLWGAYLPVQGIGDAAQQGQWVVDAARALARTIVYDEAKRQLDAGHLDEETAAELQADLDEIQNMEDQVAAGRKGAAQGTLRLTASTRSQVQEIEAQRALFAAMVAVREDQPISWDALVQAAERYAKLAPPDAATATGTAAERRTGTRQ